MEGGRPTITIERRWVTGLTVAAVAVIAGLVLALVLVAAGNGDDGWDHPDFGPEMMAPGSWPGGGDMPHPYGYGPGGMHGYGYGPGGQPSPGGGPGSN